MLRASNECGTELKTASFRSYTTDGVRHLLCPDHHVSRKYGKCQGCGKAFNTSDKEIVFYGEKNYHVEHFVCSKCHEALQPDQVGSRYLHEGKLWCPYHLSKFFPPCSGCGQSLEMSRLTFSDPDGSNNVMHEDCRKVAMELDIRLKAIKPPNKAKDNTTYMFNQQRVRKTVARTAKHAIALLQSSVAAAQSVEHYANLMEHEFATTYSSKLRNHVDLLAGLGSFLPDGKRLSKDDNDLYTASRSSAQRLADKIFKLVNEAQYDKKQHQSTLHELAGVVSRVEETMKDYIRATHLYPD
ncbi:hypothetical protein DL93DRAFT_1534445 [Clavulina sp. PMI_390]|nr:hypothetical protein DL93DRAFT_1534445 [Clavulina sp. PMI_390]